MFLVLEFSLFTEFHTYQLGVEGIFTNFTDEKKKLLT